MQARLQQFSKIFEELTESCTPYSDQWIASHLVPKDGNAEKVAAIKSELAYLAGLAEPSVVQTNAYIRTQTEAGQSITLSPVASWLTVMQPKPMIHAEDVISACRGAEGRLQIQAEDRARVEGTLAWKLAQVIGWPRRVRELAGFATGSAAAKATQWGLSGILFALVTGVVASAIWGIITAAMAVKPS